MTPSTPTRNLRTRTPVSYALPSRKTKLRRGDAQFGGPVPAGTPAAPIVVTTATTVVTACAITSSSTNTRTSTSTNTRTSTSTNTRTSTSENTRAVAITTCQRGAVAIIITEWKASDPTNSIMDRPKN
ncbi:hypothetical protein LZ554_009532 [Drepanopeziza brunnea f. sp. 'monogermtubi']|nr:hypothetical protein LZ554_009532 [Drepanopeziza brunnea f. sp. 'monogermtubi']